MFPSLEERATLPFLYLEKLIKYSLAPENLVGKEVDNEQMEQILRELDEQRIEIEDNIHGCSLLSANDDKALTLLISRYYGHLVGMLERCTANKQALENSSSPYAQLYPAIIQCILDIVAYIENEYGEYKSPDERIHPMYLTVVRDEIERLTGQIIADAGNQNSPVHGFVVKRLRKFLTMNGKITFRNAMYHQQLAQKIAEISWNQVDANNILTLIDELLIYMNFNCVEYLHYLTGRISAAVESTPDRLYQVLLVRKRFNQLPKKPDVALNERFSGLSEYMAAWFAEEIAFLKQRGNETYTEPVQVSTIRPDDREAELPVESALPEIFPVEKILCKVSTDQLAIFFRAAYVSGLLIFPSISSMFKNLAASLSTPRRADLSSKSLRTKSYSPEEIEKSKTKAILQKLIQAIDEM